MADISQIFDMDFSNLTHEFVKDVTWIFQNCYMYFSPFAKPNKDEDFGGQLHLHFYSIWDCAL